MTCLHSVVHARDSRFVGSSDVTGYLSHGPGSHPTLSLGDGLDAVVPFTFQIPLKLEYRRPKREA